MKKNKAGETAQPFKVDDAWSLQYKNKFKVGLSSSVPHYGGGENKTKNRYTAAGNNQTKPSSSIFVVFLLG